MIGTDVLPKFKALGGPIGVSQHAIEEAINDFRVPRIDAEEWVRSCLRKSFYVCEITGEQGRSGRLFGYQRIAFIVATTSDFVVTVYPRHAPNTPLNTRIQSMVMRELARLQKRSAATEKRVEREKAKLVGPRSKAAATLLELDSQIAGLDEELAVIRKELAAAAKNVVAYI